MDHFLQTDPVGYEAGDLNLYAYVGNDPLNRSDPTGMRDKPCNDSCQARIAYDRRVQEAHGLALAPPQPIQPAQAVDWRDTTSGGLAQATNGMSVVRDVQAAGTSAGMAIAGSNSQQVTSANNAMRNAGIGLAVVSEASRVDAEVRVGEAPEGSIAAAGARIGVTAAGAELGASWGAATGQPWGPPIGGLVGALAVQLPGGAEVVGEMMRDAVNGTDPACTDSLQGCPR